MVKNIISLLIVVFLFHGCYHENKAEVKKPEILLQVDVMVDILTDIQLAEGIISHNRSVKMNTDNTYKDSLYAVIFAHYKISPESFRENINYYHNDPVLMEEIYIDVLANLTRIQSDVQMDSQKEKKQKADTVKNDSVKK